MNASERLRAAIKASDDRITFVERMTTQFNNDCVIKTILSTFSNATDPLNNTGRASETTHASLQGSRKVDMKFVMEDMRVRDVMNSLVENSFAITFEKGTSWLVVMDVPKRFIRIFHEVPGTVAEKMSWDDMESFLGLE